MMSRVATPLQQLFHGLSVMRVTGSLAGQPHSHRASEAGLQDYKLDVCSYTACMSQARS